MESESRNTKPECEIKGCSNEAARAELWKNGEWYPYCEEHAGGYSAGGAYVEEWVEL